MSLGPINLSPILSGYVADRYDWRTNFWILTAFTAINLILVVLFAPETQYERPAAYNTDVTTTHSFQAEVLVQAEDDEKVSPNHQEKTTIGTADYAKTEKPLSYWQELKPYSGLHLNEKVWKHFARLCACAMYPAVIWTFLVGGTYSGWVFPPFPRDNPPRLTTKTTLSSAA